MGVIGSVWGRAWHIINASGGSLTSFLRAAAEFLALGFKW